MQEKKQVYIIHGYNANSESHWFPWLKHKLEAEDFLVDIIDMPNPLNPDKDKWIEQLVHKVSRTDEKTYFIAHSLGCVTLLHYLSSLPTKTHLGGFILVSGFSDKLIELPILDNFIKDTINYSKIINMSLNRIVISSSNDYIVSNKLSDNLAKLLCADFYRKYVGGHFLTEDGFTSFPLVYDALKGFIN